MTRMEQDERHLDAAQLQLDIKRLRCELRSPGKHKLSQAIADYMMERTPIKHRRLPTDDFPWRVGTRCVCEVCWCAAAGLLMEDRSGRGVIRPQTSVADAKAAYNRKVPDDVLDLMQRHDVEAHLGEYPEVVVVPPTRRVASHAAARCRQKEENAECWLHSFAAADDGNVQHRTDDVFDHVQGQAAEDLWAAYRSQHPAVSGGAGRSTFYKAIKSARLDGLCNLKFDKWCAQAECAECLALKIMKGRANDAGHKEYYQQELDLHNLIARSDRLSYGCNASIAESKPLGRRLWSFAMDAISSHTTSGPSCHAKPLCDLKGAPGMSAAEQLKFKTTGCIVHGYGYFMYVLEPHLPSNANSNIFCLHRTIMQMFDALEDPTNLEVQHWPRLITVQLDGASDNKCKAMFAYCEWLITIGAFEEIWVSFLIVGHTHADCDRKFVCVTAEIRKGTVISLDQLIELLKTCYGPTNAPKCVEAVRAVPDFTSWLVEGCGVDIAGMARRVPDVHRPHRFTFDRGSGEPLPGAKFESLCNYKQHASDPADKFMNVVDGKLDSFRWLKSMPSQAGPGMQAVATELVNKLRDSKGAVYRNFEPSGPTVGMFTAKDIGWYDSFYSMCATDEALSSAMANAYVWQQPSAREPEQPGVEIRFEALSKVPPICHENFTDKQRKQMIKEEKATNAVSEAMIDAAVAEFLDGKDHSRGYRALSRAAKERVASHERELIAASLGLSRKSSAGIGEPADKTFECVIVGGSSGGHNAQGAAYEMLYLVEYDISVLEVGESALQWMPAANCSAPAADTIDRCEVVGEVACLVLPTKPQP